MLNVSLAVGAALVAVAFAMSTFDRWLVRRRPYELAWTLAFVQFALAAAFLAAGSEAGWNSGLFRSFYLFGAVLDVAFLGLGEIMLLGGPTTGRRAAYGVGAFSAFALGIMVAAPFVHPVPVVGLAQGSEVFGAWPRILAATGSGVGATVVFGGAIYSAFRHRRAANIVGNLLIASGTAVSGASGILNSVFNAMTAFSVTLTAGITLIFLGFLVVTSQTRRSE